MNSAASVAPRVIGPCTDNPELTGSVGTRPQVGFRPNTPHIEAGMRIDPAPSPPWCRTSGISAAAAAAPPLDPPAEAPARQGFSVVAVSLKNKTWLQHA